MNSRQLSFRDGARRLIDFDCGHRCRCSDNGGGRDRHLHIAAGELEKDFHFVAGFRENGSFRRNSCCLPEIVSTRPVMSAALAVQISAAKTTTAAQCFISLPNGRQERIGRMTWHLPRIEQILFQRRRAGDASRASLNSLKELVPENSRIECL